MHLLDVWGIISIQTKGKKKEIISDYGSIASYHDSFSKTFMVVTCFDIIHTWSFLTNLVVLPTTTHKIKF